MDFSYLFEPYDSIVKRADYGFQRMEREFSDCIQCRPHCSDCCHAVFGLFLIEAVFLKHDFDQLDEDQKKGALARTLDADREIEKLERMLKEFQDDPRMKAYTMAKARIRCPLLDDRDTCILYPYRPITCRVYGIPTMIQGVPRVCGRSGFKKEETYPVFNLGAVQRDLHQLSLRLLADAEVRAPERASLLLSVSKVIKTPVEALITEHPEMPDTTNGCGS